MMKGKTAFGCNRFKEGCSFKINFEFGGKKLSDKQIQLLIQKPTHIQVAVNAKEQTSITLQQNYYPGWKAWYNNNSVDIIKNNSWGITIRIPKGKGIIDFRYERTSVWLTALLLHLITISFLLWKGFNWLRKFFFKSSSPS